jgi:hypothetical protein
VQQETAAMQDFALPFPTLVDGIRLSVPRHRRWPGELAWEDIMVNAIESWAMAAEHHRYVPIT